MKNNIIRIVNLVYIIFVIHLFFVDFWFRFQLGDKKLVLISPLKNFFKIFISFKILNYSLYIKILLFMAFLLFMLLIVYLVGSFLESLKRDFNLNRSIIFLRLNLFISGMLILIRIIDLLDNRFSFIKKFEFDSDINIQIVILFFVSIIFTIIISSLNSELPSTYNDDDDSEYIQDEKFYYICRDCDRVVEHMDKCFH